MKVEIVKLLKRMGWFSLKKIGLLPLFLRLRTRKRLTSVPIDRLRCQEKLFSDLQGFAGKTIDHFPPCRFYEMYMDDPEGARDAFRTWMWDCLVHKQGWQVPKAQGGWITGSLMDAIAQCHHEEGIPFDDFRDADMALVEKGIRIRVRYYLDLFESIKNRGYITSFTPPILCRSAEGGELYIENGHHRVSVLWALGYEKVPVEVFNPKSLRRRCLLPILSAGAKISTSIRSLRHKIEAGGLQ